jgi:hypothetical protein
MSRFTPARRAAIAVWTGASVVWATTLIAAGIEPQKGGSASPSESAAVTHAPSGGIPTLPPSGLVVIRTPGSAERNHSDDSEAVVLSASPTTSEPVTEPAPRPVSSGS